MLQVTELLALLIEHVSAAVGEEEVLKSWELTQLSGSQTNTLALQDPCSKSRHRAWPVSNVAF